MAGWSSLDIKDECWQADPVAENGLEKRSTPRLWADEVRREV